MTLQLGHSYWSFIVCQLAKKVILQRVSFNCTFVVMKDGVALFALYN